MDSITHYIEQRLKLRVNRHKSAVALAVERPLLGFAFFRYRDGRVGVTVAPEGAQTRPGPNPAADHAQLGRLDGAADQGDQPLHGRMDGLLRVGRHLPAIREARQVAAPQATAGALEGVEAPPNALPEPPRA